MDKVKKYQEILIEFLEEYAKIKPANMPDIENQVIADLERNHFQLVSLGWDKEHFVHSCTFHFDIKNEKIWVQANWTDIDLGAELVSRGVPVTDIVAGFHPPHLRAYTGYASA